MPISKDSFKQFGSRLPNFNQHSNRALPGEQIVELNPALIDYEPQKHTKKKPGMTIASLREFGQQLKSAGQQQPAIVRPNHTHPGRYIMVIGERRGRGCALAGIKLTVIIRDLSDDEARCIKHVENVQREALANAEISSALRQDMVRLGTLVAVANLWGMSINWVSERIKYLEAVEAYGVVVRAIENGISADVSTLNELARLEKRDAEAAQQVIEQARTDPALNIRQVVREKLSETSKSKAAASKRTGSNTKQCASASKDGADGIEHASNDTLVLHSRNHNPTLKKLDSRHQHDLPPIRPNKRLTELQFVTLTQQMGERVNIRAHKIAWCTLVDGQRPTNVGKAFGVSTSYVVQVRNRYFEDYLRRHSYPPNWVKATVVAPEDKLRIFLEDVEQDRGAYARLTQ